MVTNKSTCRLRSAPISSAIRELLSTEHDGNVEVSVLLCDDAEMRVLNHEYRGIDSPTDVLSFAQEDTEPTPEGRVLLGDVVISSETAARQGEQHGHGIETEAVLLGLHGTLHLLGYDDDTEGNLSEMIARAEQVAASLGHAVGRHGHG